MLKKTIRELSAHTIVYSIAWLASSAASIVLLPIYTKFLSKSDYGILEILDFTNIILSFIVLAGLNAAIPRFFNDTNNCAEKKRIISTAIFFVCSTGALICLISFAFNDSLALLILGKSEFKDLVSLNIILLYFQLAVNVSGVGFIAEKKSKVYMFYMLGKLIVAIAANLYFIVGLKLGVVGMLYGNIISNGLVALLITGHSVIIHGLKVDYSILKKLIWFGVPLIPASLLGMIMHNADRLLIRHYCSLDDVGLYSIGYKLPFMLNALILQSFSFIWNGATMYEISKRPDAAYQYGRITTYVIGFYLFLQFSLSIFSVSIVRILADQKFYMAHQVIPFIALGLCFHAFYFFFSVGSFLTKKTWRINIAYLPAAAVNIIGNMILLPRYGYIAAAWISVLTYMTFSIIIFFICRRLVLIDYEVRRLILLFVGAGSFYILSTFFVLENLIMEILKGIFFLLLFLAFLFICKWTSEGENTFLRKIRYGSK